MMKHIRLVGAASITLMLGVCLTAGVAHTALHWDPERSSYADVLPKAPYEEDPLVHVGEGFVVDEDFSSHLPIVILDTGGVEPPITTRLEGIRYVTIEGIEPYVPGTVTLLDQPGGENKLGDLPAAVSNIQIRRRGNSSMSYEKAQWLMKLQTESGQDNDLDLLGMGAEHEWILNGSMWDKSMMRNYLGFWLAAQTTLLVPDSRFCEVLVRSGDTYTYQGVYLLMENVKQGPNRVPIQDYQQNDSFNSYLIRRDRFEENVNILNNYSLQQGYSQEYIELLYPSRHKVTPEMTSYVEKDLSAIERVLYSDDEKTFARYRDVIDVDSFVDYFLVNEFVGNYDAGNHSTYAYKDVGGKLTMGPVWDFDNGMDNVEKEMMKVEHLAFNVKPWFEQLCRDQAFVQKLQNRYAELRRTTFSDISIDTKMQEIIDHLGGAQQREWARWNRYYTTETLYSIENVQNEDGEIINRQTTTYWDEICRIKNVLHDHGEEIPGQIKLLNGSCIWDTGMSSWRGMLLFLAAMLFLIPVYFVTYRR